VRRAKKRWLAFVYFLLQQRLGEFIKMKSFTHKALAAAAAAACGTAAFAGSQVVTAGQFAAEAITNTTPVTLPAVKLTMGVARTTAQDFTIVVKPVSSSSKFNATSCTTALPVFASNNGGAATVTVKRASADECAYEVDVTTAFLSSDVTNLTLTGLVLTNHSLGTVGNTESIKTGVWDLGETARIDNSDDLTNLVGTSYQAVTLTATADTGTEANVNDAAGPLFGFSVQNDDLANSAKASFTVTLNATLTNATGTPFSNANVDNIAFTVTGDFDGLSTNFAAGAAGSQVTFGAANSPSSVTFTAAGASSTAVFTALSNQLSSSGATTVALKLESLKTKSLGTSRTFGVSAVVDPALAGVANETLSGSSSWWTWSANAIELRSAFFNNDTSGGNFTRFFFQNVSSTEAAYTAVCQAESGVTVTYGSKKSGNLTALGTTAIDAADVCTFSTGKRGSVTFTINAPASKIKGVYQQAVNGLSGGYIPLERPYAGGTY